MYSVEMVQAANNAISYDILETVYRVVSYACALVHGYLYDQGQQLQSYALNLLSAAETVLNGYQDTAAYGKTESNHPILSVVCSFSPQP
jgi:hypothetical protein